jgi:hypothetical protein
MTYGPPASVVERTRKFLDPQRCTDFRFTESGYMDFLGEQVPPAPRIVRRLMNTEFYTGGYERGRAALRRLVGLVAPQRAGRRTRSARRYAMNEAPAAATSMQAPIKSSSRVPAP